MGRQGCEDVILVHAENHKNTFHLPLKRSERIKYTCFTVSKNYVIFGATSGGLYVFKRNPYSFLQLIPSKESAVTQITISESENFIAFVTNKGIICVLQLNESAFGKVVTRSEDFCDSEVTALCWTNDSSKPTLYIGDHNGRVAFLKLSFLSKNILLLPTTVLMSLDSKVVQLCWQNDFLLVSTLSRCYLCDTAKEQFKQIGHQLRDGLYGACFLKNDSSMRIFSARPGSRLWEVNLEGIVHSTHQFKQQLAIPPSSFISIYEEPKVAGKELKKTEWSAQSFNFIKLYDLLGRYIFTYKKDAIYILNVDMANVLFWSNQFGEILDVQCISNTIFVWNTDGDLHELVVLAIDKCLLMLYLRKHFDLCIELIHTYSDVFTEDQLSNLHPLLHLESQNVEPEQLDSLSAFKERLKSVSVQGVELRSGIYMVNNAHLSGRLLDDSNLVNISNHKTRSVTKADSEESHKHSTSLPSTVKSTDGGQETEENGYYFTPSRYFQELQTSDNLYLELGLYSSPFMTLASYEILQDSFSELGASFSEKFNESSRNLKVKWQQLENKINFLRTKRPDKVDINHIYDFSEPDGLENDTSEDSEPIVAPRKKKVTGVEFDSTKVISVCNEVDENSNLDIEKVMVLLNTVIEEYYSISEKTAVNSSFQCFPFSSLPETIFTKIKRIFSSFLEKEYFISWVQSDQVNVGINDIAFVDKYPFLLKEIFSTEQLKLDYRLSKILAIFSELLNAMTILETIKSFELPCYYMSFCYILKYFQNGEILGPNSYSKIKNSQWPLPVYLNTMLLMISLDQLQVFYEMGLKKDIEICDISYMMLHLEANKNDSGDKYTRILLTYLERVCEHKTDCLENLGVLYPAVKLFIAVNNKFESCCDSCWFLLPERTRIKVKFSKLGRQLVEQFWKIFQSEYSHVIDASQTNLYSFESLLLFRNLIFETKDNELPAMVCYKRENCEHLLCKNFKGYVRDVPPDNLKSLVLLFNIIISFCHRIPDLWKHVPKLQRNSKIKILSVEHFIQLRLMEETENCFSALSVENAKVIFNLNHTLSQGICLNCGSKLPKSEKLSWNELAILILRRLGVGPTLSLLNEFADRIELDKSFYRSLILTSIPGIKTELKEKIISSVTSHYDVNPVNSEVFQKITDALKQDNSDAELKPKLSVTNHWGISINVEGNNQAICYCCSLPLFSKSLMKEDNGGVMIFSCNHTYHTICLKNKDCTATCLVCDRFLK